MTIAGAMNLTDEQKESLSTLPIGSAVVRLADEHPEPFLVRIPRFPIREGSVSDGDIQARMAGYSAESGPHITQTNQPPAISAVPLPDKKDQNQKTQKNTRPPSPEESQTTLPLIMSADDPDPPIKAQDMSREETRFLADVAARPLSTTVSRYHRLSLSRRRGNAIRQSLLTAGVIEAVPIATRSGQVVLYQLTDFGRSVCSSVGLDPGPRPRESLEPRYWIGQAAEHFERKGYEVVKEHPIKGNGAVDLLAERPGERVVIEVETGKSDIKANLAKIPPDEFRRVILIATTPQAIVACQKAMADHPAAAKPPVELLTWLDVC